MFKSKQTDESGFGIVFSDFLIQVVFVFVFFVMVMVPKVEQQAKEHPTLPGRVCAEIRWDNNRSIDFDLWGRGPDKVSVGYSNMHGRFLDLYKDIINNMDHDNLEIMCGMQLAPGEWTFNVHYYSNHEGSVVGGPGSGAGPSGGTTLPPPGGIDADVEMTIRFESGSRGSMAQRTLKAHWHFTREGEEKTFFDFLVDQNGNLLTESINSRMQSIRSGGK